MFETTFARVPIPWGYTTVKALEVSGHRLRVAAIEAVDGTPIVDIKPVLLQPNWR
jgi:tRNA (Thr-GGU) A37 N-methylase